MFFQFGTWLDYRVNMFNLILMKSLFSRVVTFIQKEWFLLIMVATIALIVTLFELL